MITRFTRAHFVQNLGLSLVQNHVIITIEKFTTMKSAQYVTDKELE